jgi:hypothetical protein
MFDPQTYQGGLLSRLFGQSGVGQIPQSAGFPGPLPQQVGPTFANGQSGAMGGVPFQIMGQAPQQPQPTVDMSARSATPPAPPAPLTSAPPESPISALFGGSQSGHEPGGFDRLQAGLKNLAHGGITDAIRGFATGVRTDPQGIAMSQLNATYQALIKSGVPESTARAAALNPEILKTVAGNYFDTKPQFGVIGQNQMGVNQYGFIRPNQEKVTPVNRAGGPVGSAGAIDPSLTGEDFLKAVAANPEFGPGKAQMVKAIAEGRQPYPSGFLLKTPFGQWLTTAVGQYEPGLDATLIGQRATFNRQMGSSSPSSVGGQKTLMGTALGHLSELADAASSLGNSSGPLPTSVPGSSYLAHGINRFENTSVEQSAKVNALNDAVQKFAGEVGKLYSGNAGGGVGEREETRSRFSGNLTPQEMAASLEMSKALIQSKLLALENQQDQIFGKNNKARVDFLGENGKAALAKIDATIAKLRGGSSASAPASAQTSSPQFTPDQMRAEAIRRGLIKQ